MSKKKKVRTVIMAIVLILCAAGGYKFFDYYSTLKEYRTMIADMTIGDIDLSKISDGTYTGSHEAIWVAADVKVVVKDHKIVDIELVRHMNGRGEPAEVIPQKVMDAQSLQVDTISGVTSSSKVILKAIEKALLSASE